MTYRTGGEAVILHQFDELSREYHGLKLSIGPHDDYDIRGDVCFHRFHEGSSGPPIGETFAVLMQLPLCYPMEPPSVWETGARIPKEFHHYKNGSLCLGSRLAVRSTFRSNPRLLPFVDNQLVPFLYSFCYERLYGPMPFGELSHGGKGILEDYQCRFGVEDGPSALALLEFLAGRHKSTSTCPCGSGIALSLCHGVQLRRLLKYYERRQFETDLRLVMEYLLEAPSDTIKRVFADGESP